MARPLTGQAVCGVFSHSRPQSSWSALSRYGSMLATHRLSWMICPLAYTSFFGKMYIARVVVQVDLLGLLAQADMSSSFPALGAELLETYVPVVLGHQLPLCEG